MTANDDIEKGELIGLDHHWYIVIGNPIRDTQNLVAMEKNLEYILSGPVYTEIYRNKSITTFFANIASNQEESIKEELYRF